MKREVLVDDNAVMYLEDDESDDDAISYVTAAQNFDLGDRITAIMVSVSATMLTIYLVTYNIKITVGLTILYTIYVIRRTVKVIEERNKFLAEHPMKILTDEEVYARLQRILDEL